MLASSGSSFFVALRCHHNLSSSSPSMPFSNAGSLQGHGSSKVAFPLIALQWPHLFLLLVTIFMILRSTFCAHIFILSFRLTSSSVYSAASLRSLKDTSRSNPIYISYFSKGNNHSCNFPKGKNKTKLVFNLTSLLQLIRIPFIFILSTVQFHYIHPHCHYSSLHAMCVLCCVRLFMTPRTIARQAPLSMGFPRQEYWSGLIFPSLGNLPDPGIESASLGPLAFAGRFFCHCTTHV